MSDVTLYVDNQLMCRRRPPYLTWQSTLYLRSRSLVSEWHQMSVSRHLCRQLNDLTTSSRYWHQRQSTLIWVAN